MDEYTVLRTLAQHIEETKALTAASLSSSSTDTTNLFPSFVSSSIEKNVRVTPNATTNLTSSYLSSLPSLSLASDYRIIYTEWFRTVFPSVSSIGTVSRSYFMSYVFQLLSNGSNPSIEPLQRLYSLLFGGNDPHNSLTENADNNMNALLASSPKHLATNPFYRSLITSTPSSVRQEIYALVFPAMLHRVVQFLYRTNQTTATKVNENSTVVLSPASVLASSVPPNPQVYEKLFMYLQLYEFFTGLGGVPYTPSSSTSTSTSTSPLSNEPSKSIATDTDRLTDTVSSLPSVTTCTIDALLSPPNGGRVVSSNITTTESNGTLLFSPQTRTTITEAASSLLTLYTDKTPMLTTTDGNPYPDDGVNGRSTRYSFPFSSYCSSSSSSSSSSLSSSSSNFPTTVVDNESTVSTGNVNGNKVSFPAAKRMRTEKDAVISDTDTLMNVTVVVEDDDTNPSSIHTMNPTSSPHIDSSSSSTAYGTTNTSLSLSSVPEFTDPYYSFFNYLAYMLYPYFNNYTSTYYHHSHDGQRYPPFPTTTTCTNYDNNDNEVNTNYPHNYTDTYDLHYNHYTMDITATTDDNNYGNSDDTLMENIDGDHSSSRDNVSYTESTISPTGTVTGTTPNLRRSNRHKDTNSLVSAFLATSNRSKEKGIKTSGGNHTTEEETTNEVIHRTTTTTTSTGSSAPTVKVSVGAKTVLPKGESKPPVMMNSVTESSSAGMKRSRSANGMTSTVNNKSSTTPTTSTTTITTSSSKHPPNTTQPPRRIPLSRRKDIHSSSTNNNTTLNDNASTVITTRTSSSSTPNDNAEGIKSNTVEDTSFPSISTTTLPNRSGVSPTLALVTTLSSSTDPMASTATTTTAITENTSILRPLPPSIIDPTVASLLPSRSTTDPYGITLPEVPSLELKYHQNFYFFPGPPGIYFTAKIVPVASSTGTTSPPTTVSPTVSLAMDTNNTNKSLSYLIQFCGTNESTGSHSTKSHPSKSISTLHPTFPSLIDYVTYLYGNENYRSSFLPWKGHDTEDRITLSTVLSRIDKYISLRIPQQTDPWIKDYQTDHIHIGDELLYITNATKEYRSIVIPGLRILWPTNQNHMMDTTKSTTMDTTMVAASSSSSLPSVSGNDLPSVSLPLPSYQIFDDYLSWAVYVNRTIELNHQPLGSVRRYLYSRSYGTEEKHWKKMGSHPRISTNTTTNGSSNSNSTTLGNPTTSKDNSSSSSASGGGTTHRNTSNTITTLASVMIEPSFTENLLSSITNPATTILTMDDTMNGITN